MAASPPFPLGETPDEQLSLLIEQATYYQQRAIFWLRRVKRNHPAQDRKADGA
jgi:hypothetical protein